MGDDVQVHDFATVVLHFDGCAVTGCLGVEVKSCPTSMWSAKIAWSMPDKFDMRFDNFVGRGGLSVGHVTSHLIARCFRGHAPLEAGVYYGGLTLFEWRNSLQRSTFNLRATEPLECQQTSFRRTALAAKDARHHSAVP
jgi:hypothetical protein